MSDPSLPDLSHFRTGVEFVTEDALEGFIREVRSSPKSPLGAVEIDQIGKSREGRPIWGMRIGSGARRVSLTAGAHADEPVGPLTALCLARALIHGSDLDFWLKTYQISIVPQVNPDGAEQNRSWFRDPLVPELYLNRVIRELPGEDIEFGYPRPAGHYRSVDDPAVEQPLDALRPENRAVAQFLADRAPYSFHASLHGMGFSEGAWFLIGEDWAARAGALMDTIEREVANEGWCLHSSDRKGEKGFRRIRQGFSTTPNHVAMRRHFLDLAEPETADLFHPSSMEFVRSLGGDPLVMVSELPLFLIGSSPGETGKPSSPDRYQRFRESLARARRTSSDSLEGRTILRDLLQDYQVAPMPIDAQIRVQGRMIFAALQFLEQSPARGR